MNDPLIFMLAVVALLATPGPTNTLLATAGAMTGWRAALPLLIAELSGYLIAIFAVRTVLAPLIAGAPLIGMGLKLAVAVYVAWLAIKLWRQPARATGETTISFGTVFVTTLVNPKAIVVALSILPHAHPELHWYVAGFAATVLLAGGSWVVAGALLGRAAGGRRGALSRVAAVVLGGFAAALVAAAFG